MNLMTTLAGFITKTISLKNDGDFAIRSIYGVIISLWWLLVRQSKFGFLGRAAFFWISTNTESGCAWAIGMMEKTLKKSISGGPS